MGFPGRYASNAPKPAFPDAPKQKREVFGTHSNTAHMWAQQTLDHGRSSDGRMFWRGPLLHSYRTDYTIAAFTDGVLDGKQVVLFNSDTYSVSTAQHHSEALSALRGLPVTIMRVPYLDALPSHPGGLRVQHEENAKWLLDQFLNFRVPELANPRKNLWHIDAREEEAGTVNPRPIVERRVAALSGLLEPLRDYCTAFRLDLYAFADPVALELEHAAAIREAFAKYEAGAAKREKAAARRSRKTMLADAALRGRVYAFIEGVGPPVDCDDTHRMQRWRKWRSPAEDQALFSRYYEAYHRAYPRPAYEQAKRLTPEQWQAGEGAASQSMLTYSGGPFAQTLCRRVAERLETSRGAVVPWSRAVMAFKLAQTCRAKAKTWASDPCGYGLELGHYKLDRVDADGTIHAGCHVIDWDEMLRLAVREIPAEVKPTYPLPVPTGG